MADRQEDPIGILDSGVGGLSVFREIRRHLPSESLLYFADSRNCPYGSRAADEVMSLAREKVAFLLKQNCKLIVVACNTITAVCIETFRSDYPVLFIGMEPALKPAALKTRTGKIGILATENTFNGKLFKQTFERHAGGLEVFVQPGHGLAELVEKGEQNSDKARNLLAAYLIPMMEKGADMLVLGCTHYPFLKESIDSVTRGCMEIIDPSDAVAIRTRNILAGSRLLSPDCQRPQYRFFTTGEREPAGSFISVIMGRPFELVQVDGSA